MSDIGVVYMSGFPSLDTLTSTLCILLSTRLKASLMILIKNLVPEGNRVLGLNMRLSHHSIFTVLLVDDPVDLTPPPTPRVGATDDSELNV